MVRIDLTLLPVVADLTRGLRELHRRQLSEAHRWPRVGDELQKLGDGGAVIGDGPRGESAECRQVLLIARKLAGHSILSRLLWVATRVPESAGYNPPRSLAVPSAVSIIDPGERSRPTSEG